MENHFKTENDYRFYGNINFCGIAYIQGIRRPDNRRGQIKQTCRCAISGKRVFYA
jgi:hypothetical protein